jgi:hypothetical protein
MAILLVIENECLLLIISHLHKINHGDLNYKINDKEILVIISAIKKQC